MKQKSYDTIGSSGPGGGLLPPWQYAETASFHALRASGERATSRDVNPAAGLNWSVYQAPLFMFIPKSDTELPLEPDATVRTEDLPVHFAPIGSPRTPEANGLGYVLNVRDDTHRPLGIVRKRYRIVQNATAPTPLDALIKSGVARYEAAGSLSGGSQVWWLLKLDDGIRVGADPADRISTLILLVNSYDGSTSLTAGVLGFRPSSVSTLVWDIPSVQRSVKVKHTDSARERSIEGQRLLRLATAYQLSLATVGERMLDVELNEEGFFAFVDELVPTPRPAPSGAVSNQRGITMAETAKSSIADIYFEHPSLTHIRGTLWGVVHACQIHSDHRTISRTTEASPEENRFKRLTSTATVGGRAFSLALRFLNR